MDDPNPERALEAIRSRFDGYTVDRLAEAIADLELDICDCNGAQVGPVEAAVLIWGQATGRSPFPAR